ncbi:MAG TPA: DUF3810 domain-containing protein [Clostridiales bacterium]|nr:DUF3810 domain-containing protein [Clostridiales bacterium]
MKIYKRYFIYLAVFAFLTLLFHIFKHLRPVMNAVTNALVPVKRALSWICDITALSVAEFLIAAAIIFALYYIVKSVVLIIKSENRLPVFLKRLLGALCGIITVYFGMALMLGTTYYSDSFQEKSGLYARGGTVDELYSVAGLFAEKATETGALVSRDENGVFNVPLDTIFENSKGIYKGAEQEFPTLSGPDRRPKKVILSRLMSYFNNTGFYFPFTAEANINIDCPLAFIPATIAHEFAHQRGVAAEQEANFAAIIACITSGKPEYEYSGWLLGYIYLVNALYSRDYDKFVEVYGILSDEVMADIIANNEYWAQFETPVSEISDKVYDEFLKGYGQELGVQSYGAVVDLLLAYFR